MPTKVKMVLRKKKLWYHGQNYGTSENYGTLDKTMELRLTKEKWFYGKKKTMVLDCLKKIYGTWKKKL